MDYDLKRVIAEAWARIEPILRADPDQLADRRARRRKRLLLGPPRAWCLAVRASDLRITPMDFIMSTDHPIYWDKHANRYRHVEHTVTLQASELRWLCRPVNIRCAGEDHTVIAEMLGVTKYAIHAAIKRGTLRVRYMKGVGGKRGHPVPLVSSAHVVDPAAIPLGRPGDPAWGTLWAYASEHIPDDLCQTLTRRPVYQLKRGIDEFHGWRWICPGCGREANRIFYPIPPLLLAPFVGRSDDGSPDSLQSPLPCFACVRCHNINYAGRLTANDWNRLISCITGGLLYGNEVQRPAWWAPTRLRQYKPRPGCAPSKRQAQVESFLVQTDLSVSQIAKRLGVSNGTVCHHLWKIYKRNNVHCRSDLRKLKLPHPQSSQAAG